MKEDLIMRHYIILIALLSVGLTSCKYNKSPPVSVESEDKSLVNQWFGPNHFKKTCTTEDPDAGFYSPFGYTSDDDKESQKSQSPSNCDCPQALPNTPLHTSLDLQTNETPYNLGANEPFENSPSIPTRNGQNLQQTPGGAI